MRAMTKPVSPEWKDEWRLLSPLLDQALALEGEERQTWIKAQEPEIAYRLEILLLEHSVLASDGFLETGVVDLPSTAATLAGQTIGAFEVVSQIGQGGMGSVWLARRNDGRFERQVALKFLNIALLGKEGEDRFKREGKILALLAHRHIAELIDAGVTITGQPYLVLEYVNGDQIDRYCDQRRLDLPTRIRLFLQVLDAVAAAHANLIVHRDLKPSNVLVRKDGDVKLLDFGIAKLIEAENGPEQHRTFTLSGTALTPQYAAPEQLKSEAITVCTDVYALGVLLYLLLTGRHPTGEGQRSPAELVKTIVELEPLRASDAVASGGADSAARALLRSATVEKLRRVLRGDLDTILAKALKKDPRERYASVGAFADDLRRYLKCEPIKARPDTLRYRAGKFARRHRGGLFIALLALAGVAAGITGMLLQARTARVQRDLALRQLARAERMTDLNELLLSNAAPVGKPLAVDELLEREERVIEHERNPDAANHVELQLSLGNQYSSEDENANALRVLNAAYRVSRDLKEPSIRAKASCVLAGAMVPVGELSQAEALYQEGLRELGNAPQFASERAACLLHGSEVAFRNGNSNESIARARAAEQAIQRSPAQWTLQGLNILVNLGTVLGDGGNFREAETIFQRASDLMTALGYDDSQKAVKLFDDWALTLSWDGRELEAQRLYRRALDISRDDETNNAVAPDLLLNYAVLLQELGHRTEAVRYFVPASKKALAFNDNVLTDSTQLMQANMFTDAHAFDQATRQLDELEQRLRKRYAPQHWAFAEVSSERARIALGRGDLPAAAHFAKEAVELDEASIRRIGQCAALLSTLLVSKSGIDLKNGQQEEAVSDARRAIKLLEDREDPNILSSNVGRAYLALARVLEAKDKPDEAQLAAAKAYANLQTTLGPDQPDTLSARQLTNSRFANR
jgi:serine/threonine protein kinase/tetratricopeptide (TPR) repeat protein